MRLLPFIRRPSSYPLSVICDCRLRRSFYVKFISRYKLCVVFLMVFWLSTPIIFFSRAPYNELANGGSRTSISDVRSLVFTRFTSSFWPLLLLLLLLLFHHQHYPFFFLVFFRQAYFLLLNGTEKWSFAKKKQQNTRVVDGFVLQARISRSWNEFFLLNSGFRKIMRPLC